MRPEILFPLFAPASSLKGVGPKIAPLVEKLAGPHVRDVLFLCHAKPRDAEQAAVWKRLVDGELGARFLGAIRRRLEDAASLRRDVGSA